MIRVLLTLLLAALLALGWSLWRTEVHKGAAKSAEARAESAEAAADMLVNVIEAERAKATQLAAIAEIYEQEKQDAQAVADRVADDLRAGNLRLRREIGALYTAQLSGATAGAAVDHAAAERGIEIAAAAVRVGAESDAQLRACQAIVKADREP
ncbi:MAG: lysis protein [Rhodobacteraceae bacterium]|nr:lysis protein [Paracoccaceae bacterium]